MALKQLSAALVVIALALCTVREATAAAQSEREDGRKGIDFVHLNGRDTSFTLHLQDGKSLTSQYEIHVCRFFLIMCEAYQRSGGGAHRCT